MEAQIKQAEAAIGYTFQDKQLLQRALTHRSYANEHNWAKDNERLEFLGDSVLGFIVSSRLYSACLDSVEGELSRQRASLVNTRALARVARRLDLGPLLFLGRGEHSTGGADKTSLLADVVEALIGAVYVDAGIEAAQSFIERLLGAEISRVAKGEAARDYKSELQETLQAKGWSPPVYEVVEELGPDHNKIFVVRASVQEHSHLHASAQGTSKKKAESEAARQLLTVLDQSE